MAGHRSKVPWPLSSAPGARPQESAGRLIGCYAEPFQKESGPSEVVWRRSPGLTSFAATGQSNYRGGILVTNLAFIAMTNALITVDSAGVVVFVGALSGTLPVTFARNNAASPNICCVTENGAFLVTSSSIAAWPDADLPQPNSVSFQDGYFFWTIGDRRAFASDINSTAVNSLSYISLQSRSDDTCYRGIPFNSLMYFFMSSSCEVYTNAGSAIAAPAFPYSRTTVVDRGLIGPFAIAGWETGFGKLIWVADDFGVYRFQGWTSFSPEKISPPDLDRAIETVADKTTLRASCYVHAGHSFWVISSPTWTWEFNCNTEKWNEKWNIATTGLITTRWRADGGFKAFDKWLMGSSSTGNIVKIDSSSYKEEGDRMMCRMESGPVVDFPNRIRVARADFDFVTGVGIPGGAANEQDPTVQISYSDNDGVDWKNPLIRKLGAGNDSKKRVSLTGCGQSGPQGRRWRTEITDGVYVGFQGSTMSSDSRAS